LGRIQVLEIGPTPYAWASPIRKAIRSIQRKFTTGVILTLVSFGLVLLLLARNRSGLVILLVVPLYYLILQSPLHTEYRYILAMHYFLFVFAGASVGSLPAALLLTSRWARKMLRQLQRQQRSGEPAPANARRTATSDHQSSS
jgi:uncharacterized metal-binding protein